MVRVIAFVSRKGGVGKSTLTIETAVAACHAGQKVALVDLDPQGSLVLWKDYRERHGGDMSRLSVHKTSHLELPALIEELGRTETGWIFVDTPGQESGVVSEAIKASDLALIPTRASVLDLEPAAATVEHAMRLGRSYAYVFNLTKPSKAIDELKQALVNAGLPVCPVTVPEQTEFLAGLGRGQGIVEFRPNSPAAQNITQLWTWINGRITDA